MLPVVMKACSHCNTIFCLLLLEVGAACYFCICPVCKTSWELQGGLLWALVRGDLGWEQKGCIAFPSRGRFHLTAVALPSVLMLQFHEIMGYRKAPKQNPANVSNAKNPKHSKWRCFLEAVFTHQKQICHLLQVTFLLCVCTWRSRKPDT